MENKNLRAKGMKLVSIIVAITMLASALFAIWPIVSATEPIIISVAPGAQNRRLGNTFTLNITVNPNGTAIDTVTTDYLFWDYGKLELKNIELGTLFTHQTTTIGWGNYTPLPESKLIGGETKYWNYTLPTQLTNLNNTLTRVYIQNLNWNEGLKVTVKINGVQVHNFTVAPDGDGNAVAITNLAEWKSQGAPTNVAYLNMSVQNWGVNQTSNILLYTQDSNKRVLVWGSDVSRSQPLTRTFAILTFEAIGTGTCNFKIDPSRVTVALGGVHRAFTLTNGSINIFAKYYPQVISSFTATAYNRTRIDLSWTKGYWTDKVVVRGKIGSYPTDQNDGTAVYNGTGSSTQQTGLHPGEHWYYRAWSYNATDHVFSETPANADATTLSNNAPVLSSESPANLAPNVDKMQSSVSVHIADPNGDTMSWSIHTSHGESNNGVGAANSTVSCNLNTPLPYGTIITWYANVTDGFVYTNATYSFTVRDEYIPGEPGSFDATTYNRTQIDLSFTRGTGSDKTYIEWNDHATWAIGGGTAIYNGTGTTFGHQNLKDGTQYYYQSWGWNSTDKVYSTSYMSDDATTVGNYAPTFSGERPADNSGNVDKTQSTVNVTINDQEGDLMHWTIHGTHVTTATGTNGNGSIQANLITPLPYGANVIWYVNMTDGFDWTNATYNFTVRAEYVPSAPTSFDANAVSTSEIDLTWITGATGTDKTRVEWNTVPTWTRGTGNEIYNSTGTSYQHTGREPHRTYYYQAWSYNATDHVYSTVVRANDSTWDTTPSRPGNERPVNNTPYLSVYNSSLNVTATDGDGDTIEMDFYWGNGTAIAFTTVPSGHYANISLPLYIDTDWLTHDTTYTWYAIANDTFGGLNQSALFNFHTSKAWDINEDTHIDGLDVSLLVYHYGASLVAGSKGWDINNDGHVDGLDVSGLVYHYGTNY